MGTSLLPGPFVLTWLSSKNTTHWPSSLGPGLARKDQENRPRNSVWLTYTQFQCSKCPPMTFQPLKQTCEYCTEQNIPFPSYSIQEDDKSLKECYLMENPQEPDAPIVAYFPLISDTFQKYKAPGKAPPMRCSQPLLETDKSPCV